MIQAYKTAAKEAIENGEIIELEVFEWVNMSFDYSAMPQMMHLLKQHQLQMKEQVFETSCTLITNLPLNKKDLIKEEINKIGNCTIEIIGTY